MQRWWHKRVYHMYSDVIFGWILWIWLSSWNFCLNILILFSQSLENVIFSFFLKFAWKFAGGSEEAEGRRRPPANFQAIAKQNQNTQKKVPTTQPNAQYSAKNNVSIHVIDTFMPFLQFHFHFLFSVISTDDGQTFCSTGWEYFCP